MPILFSAVARDKSVAAKYASCDGNFLEIIEEVISKIPTNNHKMTYSHGYYLFHYIVEDAYVYFCITVKTCQRSRAFLYLNEIKRRYQKERHQFHRVLAAEMQRYSEDCGTIVIRKGELDELNSISVGCSETILGEKILFVNNPENLSFSTVTYVGEAPLSSGVSMETSKEKSNSLKLYLTVLTVIIVLIWLGISVFGPVSVVLVACIIVMSFVRLSKLENKS